MYLQSVCSIPRFYNNTSGIILQIFWSNTEESTPDTLYHCLRSLPLVLQVFKQIYKKNLQKITIFFTYQCYQDQEILRQKRSYQKDLYGSPT